MAQTTVKNLGLLNPLGQTSDLITIKKPSFGQLFLWWIILSALAWVILFALKPTVVRKTTELGLPTEEIDQWKLLGFAVLIGFALLAIVLLLKIFTTKGI